MAPTNAEYPRLIKPSVDTKNAETLQHRRDTSTPRHLNIAERKQKTVRPPSWTQFFKESPKNTCECPTPGQWQASTQKKQ